MIKTIITTTGVNTVTFPEFFKFFWIRNIGENAVYASAYKNISPAADNTSVVNSDDIIRVDNVDNPSVYIYGESALEIHATDYPNCPFKVGAKGGETPDLSAYAKTADVPNIKVNSAVNADTVDGFPAATFMRYEVPTELLTSINDMVTTGTYGVFYATPDFPTGYGDWGFLEVRRFGSICYQTIIFDTGKVITRAITIAENNNTWTEWHEPYTNIDKPYISGSATVAANGTTCTSNHGFTPSAVIWWDGNDSGVAVSFSNTQFTIDKTSSVDRTINYLMFK